MIEWILDQDALLNAKLICFWCTWDQAIEAFVFYSTWVESVSEEACSKRSITKSLTQHFLMSHMYVPLVTEFHSVRPIFKQPEMRDDTNKQWSEGKGHLIACCSTYNHKILQSIWEESAYIWHITNNHWRITWDKIKGENFILHISCKASIPWNTME